MKARTLILAVAVGWLVPARAGAQGVEVNWVAPPGCPARSEVVREAERRLGRSLSEIAKPALRAEIAIVTTSSGYRLSLRLSGDSAGGRDDGTRELEGKTCAELADAAALILALAVDPDSVDSSDAARVTPLGQTGTRSGEANASGSMSSQGRSAPAETRTEPQAERERDETERDETERDETEPDEPERLGPEQDGPKPEPETDEDEEQEQADEDEGPPGPPLAVSMYARAALGGDIGALQSVGLGPEVAGGVVLGALRLELSGLWLPAHDITHPDRPRPVASLDLLSVGVAACYEAGPAPVALAPCLRGSYAVLRGEGSQHILTRAKQRVPWGLVELGLALGFELEEPIFATVEVGVGLPLGQPVFTVEDVGEVHKVAPLVARMRLGLALRF